MHNFIQDLRFAFRQFRKSPGFVITAVLSLMLGICATTAIFSVIYGVLLDPYPYKDNDRMVHIDLNDKSGRGPLMMVSGTGYQQLKQTSAIEDLFEVAPGRFVYAQQFGTLEIRDRNQIRRLFRRGAGGASFRTCCAVAVGDRR